SAISRPATTTPSTSPSERSPRLAALTQPSLLISSSWISARLLCRYAPRNDNSVRSSRAKRSNLGPQQFRRRRRPAVRAGETPANRRQTRQFGRRVAEPAVLPSPALPDAGRL